MPTKRQTREVLERSFNRRPVLDMPQLKGALDASRVTVFRALVDAGYHTSYSDGGRFYTLEQTPVFNEDGIWEWHGKLFSRFGTLRDTVKHMVDEAQAGQTHAELQSRVRLRVQDTLHDLLNDAEIARERFNHVYVYLSTDTDTAQAQMRGRRELLSASQDPLQTAPDPQVVIKVLMGFIEHPHDNMSQLAVRLRRHGVSREQVDKVFTIYQLEKKTPWRRLPS